MKSAANITRKLLKSNVNGHRSGYVTPDIITGDESCGYRYDIKTEAELSRVATIKEIKEKSKLDLLAIL